MDIITFMTKFKSDKDCLDYLREKKYKGFKCPKCSNSKFYMIYDRKCMECSKCGHQEYLTAGTIFHKSSTHLIKWFYAIQLMVHSKKGISALQIKRMVKVTYKTAWRMAHKIREAMDKDDDDSDMFGGITQVDETYIGGQQKGKRGRGSQNKSIVVGGVEHIEGKPTRVECDVIKSVDSQTLLKFIQGKVKLDTEVHTDTWGGYSKLKANGFNHKKVNHDKYFVFNGISTQSIEGFWSLLKRGINGAFHHVSKKWLSSYLNEFEFRYNHREKGGDEMFDLVLARV